MPKRPRNSLLIEYMLALRRAREEKLEAESHTLDMHVERHELFDMLAHELGIDETSEEWWDSTYQQKLQKIIGRIRVLRGRPITPALPRRGLLCKCGLKMLYGRKHLHCPAEVSKDG